MSIGSVGLTGSGLDVVNFSLEHSATPNPCAATVQIAVGLGALDMSSSSSVDLPDVRLWDEEKVYLGHNVKPQKVTGGDAATRNVPYSDPHGKTTGATYALFTATDGPLCIAYATMTGPDGGRYGWLGDWAQICGYEWYYSNTVVPGTSKTPLCMWIDKTGGTKYTALQIHWPDFLAPANWTELDVAQKQKYRKNICEGQASFIGSTDLEADSLRLPPEPPSGALDFSDHVADPQQPVVSGVHAQQQQQQAQPHVRRGDGGYGDGTGAMGEHDAPFPRAEDGSGIAERSLTVATLSWHHWRHCRHKNGTHYRCRKHRTTSHASVHATVHSTSHATGHSKSLATGHTKSHTTSHTKSHTTSHAKSHTTNHTKSHATSHTKSHTTSHTTSHTKSHTTSHTKSHATNHTKSHSTSHASGTVASTSRTKRTGTTAAPEPTSTPMVDTRQPKGLVRRGKSGLFDGHLVISSVTEHSAVGLCSHVNSVGPDFVNVVERWFCRMSDKRLFPLCGGCTVVDCFSVDSMVLVVGGEGRQTSPYKITTRWGLV